MIIRGVAGDRPVSARGFVVCAFVQSIARAVKPGCSTLWQNTSQESAVRRTNYRLFYPAGPLTGTDDLGTINVIVSPYPAFLFDETHADRDCSPTYTSPRCHTKSILRHLFKPLPDRRSRDALEGVSSRNGNPGPVRNLTVCPPSAVIRWRITARLAAQSRPSRRW